MATAAFLDTINLRYFDGQLSPANLDQLNVLDPKNEEGIAFAEGVMARMKRIGISAQDSAELVFWEIGSILPKILPGAWGGIVPPITFQNRHVLVEEYLKVNRWNPLIPGNRVLDMGCGFPPLTAVDMARRFPEVMFTGADPSFGKYTVTDKDNNYACLLEDGSLKYMQPGNISTTQWNDVFDDLPATKVKFLSLFRELEKQLPRKDTAEGYQEHSENGFTIVRNPLRKYALPNLDFEEKGIGADDLPDDYDMIRCMNVLLYFDPPFRAKTLEWAARRLREGGLFISGLNYAQSINTRISVYQKDGGKMRFREFAFSPDNIRPMEVVSYFSFRNDDFEQDNLLEQVSIIRKDKPFMNDFNAGFDRILAEQHVCSRNSNGYLGFPDLSLPPGELQLNMHRAGRQLSREYAEKAAAVLRNHGQDAWVNEVGFVSVGGSERI